MIREIYPLWGEPTEGGTSNPIGGTSAWRLPSRRFGGHTVKGGVHSPGRRVVNAPGECERHEWMTFGVDCLSGRHPLVAAVHLATGPCPEG